MAVHATAISLADLLISSTTTSPACHSSRRWHSGQVPGQSVWNLWRTNWEWDRFLSKYLGFLLLITISVMLHSHSSVMQSMENGSVTDGTSAETFTKDTALSEDGRGTARHVWISATRHGRSTVWYVWISLNCDLLATSLNKLRQETSFASGSHQSLESSLSLSNRYMHLAQIK